MIDFANASFIKLREVQNASFLSLASRLFLANEHVIHCFQGIRDGVVITNLRLMTINVQGISGKKKDFSSIPFSKLQAFSVETAGLMDIDNELVLWFGGLGVLKLEFTPDTDILEIGALISRLTM